METLNEGFLYHPGENGGVVIDGISMTSEEQEEICYEMIIPDTLDGCTVTAIGEYAFECCSYLKRVVLPKSLKLIEECAFWGCKNLTEVKFGDIIEHMGDGAFYACPLSEIYLPSMLKNSVFGLFTGNRYVPMESLDDDDKHEVFSREGLKAVRVSGDNPRFTAEDGILFDKEKKELLCYPSDKIETTYTVPYGIKVIGSDAFYNSKNLQQVILPDTLEYIESYAFSGSGIRKIWIPDSVIFIGKDVFRGCPRLTEIHLPKDSGVSYMP